MYFQIFQYYFYLIQQKGGVYILLNTSEKHTEAGALNGLSLAFIGDSVYELLVREYLLKNGSMPIGKLHSLAVEFVRASAQAHFFDIAEPQLNEDELSILYRGRNASSSHIPKGACAIEYRKATGVEALFGWLYLEGRQNRIRELFDLLLQNIPKEASEV